MSGLLNEEEPVISRQKFIAEVSKLLSCMTERDREATLAKYNRLFDEALNEDDVLMQLGSPTRVAIAELRGYVPSAEPEAADVSEPEPDAPPPGAPEARAGTGGLIAPEPVQETLADRPGPAADGVDPEAACLPDLAALEAAIADIESGGGSPGTEPVSDASPAPEPPETPETSETPEPPRRRTKGGRLTLYILFGVLVCVPAAVLLIALSLGILVFGAGLVMVGGFTISLGFIGITIFADIMLLLGAGLIVAAAGVPVVFFAVWFFSRAAVGFINLILRTGGKWCYEQAEEAQP